jgi:hypothetical protein
MKMRGRDLVFFLGFWHRIPVSAKVANGFIEKMCLLWWNCSEGKYVEG